MRWTIALMGLLRRNGWFSIWELLFRAFQRGGTSATSKFEMYAAKLHTWKPTTASTYEVYQPEVGNYLPSAPKSGGIPAQPSVGGASACDAARKKQACDAALPPITPELVAPWRPLGTLEHADARWGKSFEKKTITSWRLHAVFVVTGERRREEAELTHQKRIYIHK